MEHHCWRSTRVAWRWCAVLTLLAAALLPLTTTPARAQTESAYAIEVILAGWDGVVAGGTWTPVRLAVTGGNEDVDALVEVVVQSEIYVNPTGTPTRVASGAYAQEIALSAGESREVTVWFPADYSAQSAQARLLVRGDAVAEADIAMRLARPGWPLIAVISDAPELRTTLSAIELPYQGLPLPLAVAGLSIDAIPDDPTHLQAINALVVHGALTAALTGTQREAVHEWVIAGGDLIVVGGTHAAQAAQILPEGVVSASFVGQDSGAAMEGLAGWLPGVTDAPETAPAAGIETRGGLVLAGSGEQTLAWREDIGSGTATYLAVDPTLEPFSSWSGTSDLLRAALASALPDGMTGEMYPSHGAFDPSMNLQGSVMTLPEGAHPDWAIIATILAGFALLAGPLTYLFLRSADRPELAWAVVPAMALVASGAIYYSGVEASGRDLIVNVASYINVGDEHEPARQSVAAAFYGPTHQHLSLPLDQQGSVRVVNQNTGYPWGPQDITASVDPPFRLIEGQNRRVEFLGGEYGVRSVLLERQLEEAPRVHAEMTLQDGLLVGSVRNDTPFVLEDAAVVIGTNLVALGQLAPGQTTPVRLEPSSVASDPMRGEQPLSHLLWGEVIEQPGMPPGYEYRTLPNDREVQRRAQILDQMVMYAAPWQPYFGGAPNVPLTFVAFTRTATVPDSLIPGDQPSYQLTMLQQQLGLSLAPGPFVIPNGLLTAQITEVSSPYGLGGGGDGQRSWMELHGGHVTFSFQLALPDDATIEGGTLRTEQIGQKIAVGAGMGGAAPPPPMPSPGVVGAGDPAEAGVFLVYDWTVEEWRPLPAGLEHALEGARHVGPNFEVRVRAQTDDSELVRFVMPELTLEGTAADGGAR